MLESEHVSCPYCFERIELVLDLSAGSATYVEDCSVCCQPIVVHLQTESSGDSVFGTDSAAEDESDAELKDWRVWVDRENG